MWTPNHGPHSPLFIHSPKGPGTNRDFNFARGRRKRESGGNETLAKADSIGQLAANRAPDADRAPQKPAARALAGAGAHPPPRLSTENARMTV